MLHKALKVITVFKNTAYFKKGDHTTAITLDRLALTILTLVNAVCYNKEV